MGREVDSECPDSVMDESMDEFTGGHTEQERGLFILLYFEG